MLHLWPCAFNITSFGNAATSDLFCSIISYYTVPTRKKSEKQQDVMSYNLSILSLWFSLFLSLIVLRPISINKIYVCLPLYFFQFAGCSKGYQLDRYPSLRHLNSQVTEQVNAGLKRIKDQLSYMTNTNFRRHCLLYLYNHNAKLCQSNTSQEWLSSRTLLQPSTI